MSREATPTPTRGHRRRRSREQLEQLRSGGLERSSREAETMALIDTGRMRQRPPTGPAAGARLAACGRALRRDRRARRCPTRDRTDEVIAERRLGVGLSEEAPASDPQAAAGRERRTASERDGSPQAQPPQISAAVRPAVRYRAFDFTISRQRSWGTPIPIVYCVALRHGAGCRASSSQWCCRSTSARPAPATRWRSSSEFVQTTCPVLRRARPARDRHARLPLRRAVAVGSGVRAPEARESRRSRRSSRSRTCARWLPSERLVAGSDSGNFVFDQRIVTKALRDIGPLGVPGRRRAVRGLPLPRDGDPATGAR